MSKAWFLICVFGLPLQTVAAVAGAGQGAETNAPRRCITGHIVSSESGRSIDATVRLDGFEDSTTCSTVGGHFTCCGVGGGSYELQASAPGYGWARISVDPSFNQTSPVTVALEPRGARELPRAAGLNPTVPLQSLKVPPEARQQLNHFLRDAERKDWAKALRSLRKAVEIYPDYVDAWMNMGIVYVNMNDPDKAESAFKKAVDIDPGNAAARRKLGYLYLSCGVWNKALEQLNISKTLEPSDARTDTYLKYVKDHMANP